jgi:hypothetical protein
MIPVEVSKDIAIKGTKQIIIPVRYRWISRSVNTLAAVRGQVS